MSQGEHQRRKEHLERMDSLRKRMHQKVDFHLKKGYVDAGEFYVLVRDFFGALLDKQYEATYEEISQELEELEHEFLSIPASHQKQAHDLLQALTEHEYSGKPLTQERAREILTEFRSLIAALTSMESGTIDQFLADGIRAANDGNHDHAKKQYRQAHERFTNLSTSEQQKYYDSLQSLYKLLNQ